MPASATIFASLCSADRKAAQRRRAMALIAIPELALAACYSIAEASPAIITTLAKARDDSETAVAAGRDDTAVDAGGL